MLRIPHVKYTKQKNTPIKLKKNKNYKNKNSRNDRINNNKKTHYNIQA